MRYFIQQSVKATVVFLMLILATKKRLTDIQISKFRNQSKNKYEPFPYQHFSIPVTYLEFLVERNGKNCEMRSASFSISCSYLTSKI